MGGDLGHVGGLRVKGSCCRPTNLLRLNRLDQHIQWERSYENYDVEISTLSAKDEILEEETPLS